MSKSNIIALKFLNSAVCFTRNRDHQGCLAQLECQSLFHTFKKQYTSKTKTLII